ncbi:MAG TPA: phosphotransferase, partial [Chloroflexota bacterium]
ASRRRLWNTRHVSWKVRGGLGLAGSAARAMALVGRDSVLDKFGRSLPRRPEDLARTEFMTALLGVPVLGVRLPGRRFDSSNCQNFLVEIVDAEGATRSLYVKLPALELGPRVFANTLGYWHLECAFCVRVAPHVPVRVPRVEAVVERRSRFVIVLEDLSELPGARMFVNADMAAGTTPAQARRCISALAQLHAGFHGISQAKREQLLPRELHPYLSPSKSAAMRALNHAALLQARRKAPEILTAAVADSFERTLEGWDALVTHWYAEPLTLVHGDSHLANYFEYDSAEGPTVGMLDFQGAHWSKGIRDVAYFLIHSLEPDLLAAHEEALIEFYLEEMSRRGVELDPQVTRDDYRGFSVQALMVGVVAVGLGGFTERESTVATMLQREVAAIERLDFVGWVERHT